MNDDLNGRQSRDWDEGKNATGRRFYPRSNENKELKERAAPRRATTIFSEVKSRGEKPKSTRLFVAAVRPIPVRSSNTATRAIALVVGFASATRRSGSLLTRRRVRGYSP